MVSWKQNVIMLWDGEKVSDHGRQPLAVDTEKIEQKDRMLDGTMRKYLVATKFTFSSQWDNIPSRPHANFGPVDGGMSGTEMKDFVKQNTDPITLTLRDGAGNEENYTVYFEDFSFDIAKRGINTDLWNVTVSLVEV